jgi:hypothetical protein
LAGGIVETTGAAAVAGATAEAGGAVEAQSGMGGAPIGCGTLVILLAGTGGVTTADVPARGITGVVVAAAEVAPGEPEPVAVPEEEPSSAALDGAVEVAATLWSSGARPVRQVSLVIASRLETGDAASNLEGSSGAGSGVTGDSGGAAADPTGGLDDSS